MMQMAILQSVIVLHGSATDFSHPEVVFCIYYFRKGMLARNGIAKFFIKGGILGKDIHDGHLEYPPRFKRIYVEFN